MNAMQQHMIDVYRAAQRGEAAPPLPGAGDVRALRAVRDRRRFEAVVTPSAGRLPARGLLRAVRALLGRRTPASAPVGHRPYPRQEVREHAPHVGGSPAQCG
ncbi:hypothetical protein [Streptomyces violens]|uniref:hypothetical protein n=1 Tax=Streptomyces violens TaxID=66377 RepID=UPI0004C26DB9|nr:hypothetical protein [Streptomyces violens]